jgi:N-acetylmuramoyl-L-alanine amidase
MPARFATSLAVEMIDRTGTARLARALVYEAADGTRHEVPAGFTTDLASIPQVAQAVIGKWEAHAPAAVLHDWLYADGCTPRPAADALFYEAMRAAGTPGWKRTVMWAAVRVAGGRYFPSRPPVLTRSPAMLPDLPPHTIRDGRLWIGDTPAMFVASPNIGGRMEPTTIVEHDTAGATAASSIAWLTDPKAAASAHFVIARDGRITQLVPTDRVAWHCGKAAWRGRTNVNGFSVGIELDNPGRLVGTADRAVSWFGRAYTPADGDIVAAEGAHWLAYTDAQMASHDALVAALVAAHPIVEIIGHRDISPGRKVDPTPLFPWEAVRACLGERAPADTDAVREIQEALAALGYWPGTCDGHIGPRTRSALRDFQEQQGLPITGTADEATTATLFSEHAKPAPTGGREDVTARDLRKGGSAQALAAAAQKRIAETVGVATTAGAASLVMDGGTTSAQQVANAASTVNVIARASEAVAQAETATRVASRSVALGDAVLAKAGAVGHVALTPIGLLIGIVLAGAAAMWLAGHLQERARVRAARSGQHVGL